VAIVLGTHSKSQVRVAIALFAAVGIIGFWEIYNSTSMGRSSRVRPSATQVGTQRRDRPGRANETSRFEFRLRIDELSRSESVEYKDTGRNVFSKGQPAVVIEAPLVPARTESPMIAAGSPQDEPKRPAMDLKYLGYTEGGDKVLCALIVHGDDLFMARTGDIMFHRFKVGVILPSSVQVTDLSFNYSQTLSALSN
jgi:hypothetical protein